MGLTFSSKKAQFKIQQMAFMLIAVFLFFILVGLGFVGYQVKSVRGNYDQLQKDQAISSLQVLTDLPEFSCGYLCLDEEKLTVMSRGLEDYRKFSHNIMVGVWCGYESCSSTPQY